jgi:hypothetical protein
MTGAGKIRVGIGGWVFPPWRGAFYPSGLRQADELGYASRQVTAIEINGTFYGSQKPQSFRRWHDETPDDFIFSLTRLGQLGRICRVRMAETRGVAGPEPNMRC